MSRGHWIALIQFSLSAVQTAYNDQQQLQFSLRAVQTAYNDQQQLQFSLRAVEQATEYTYPATSIGIQSTVIMWRATWLCCGGRTQTCVPELFSHGCSRLLYLVKLCMCTVINDLAWYHSCWLGINSLGSHLHSHIFLGRILYWKGAKVFMLIALHCFSV